MFQIPAMLTLSAIKGVVTNVISFVWRCLKIAWSWLSKLPATYLLVTFVLMGIAWWVSGQIGYNRGGDVCHREHEAVATIVRKRVVTIYRNVERNDAIRDAHEKAMRKQIVDLHARLAAAMQQMHADGKDTVAIPAAIADQLRQLDTFRRNSPAS